MYLDKYFNIVWTCLWSCCCYFVLRTGSRVGSHVVSSTRYYNV